MVAPRVEQTSDGVNDPTYWEGLDVVSQGAVAESIPQPPQSEAEWQHQVEAAGETSPDAPNITGLAVSAITSTGAVVDWTTDKPATAQVKYGTVAGQYGNATAIQDAGNTTHNIPLTGLTALTTYYVQAGSRDAGGHLAAAEIQFSTV